MSGPSKSPGGQTLKSPESTNTFQKKSGSSQKTDGHNIFVFTPSKLRELGFVAKVEGGKTVLIKPQDSSSILKHALNAQVERRKSCDSIAARPSPESTSTVTSTESVPGRRRIIQGFSRHWSESVKKDGFIKCPLRQCTFISLRHEDMCSHYIICNGLANNTEFVCPTCKCCLKSKDDLELHIDHSHSDSTIELQIVGSPRARRQPPSSPLTDVDLIVRKRGYSKVHKQAWTIAVAEKGYVKCIFQNCIFMALSVDEMIEHYRCCNSKGLEKLFVCPECNGGVQTEEKLRTHMSVSHSEAKNKEETSAYKAVSISDVCRSQEKKDLVNAGSLKGLVHKPAVERWNPGQRQAVDDFVPIDQRWKRIASSPKTVRPAKRPCYAPDVVQVRQPRPPLRCAAVSPPLPPAQSSPMTMPASSGQVCTFIKRRPNQSSVDLFPLKVCKFVKNARLSETRRLSAVERESKDSVQARVPSPSGQEDGLVIDMGPVQECQLEGQEETVVECGVDYYISESSREVVYQEVIAEETEYIISDMIEDKEDVPESASMVEIKYFHNVGAESQGFVEKKSAVENPDSVKNEIAIVASDVSKDELNISANDGIDCPRLTENIKLKQLPLQIADHFVSDPLASDSLEGTDRVESDLFVTHNRTELMENLIVPSESFPFHVKKECEVSTITASTDGESHGDVCTTSFAADDFHQSNSQDDLGYLENNRKLGSPNLASGSSGSAHNLTVDCSSIEAVERCESHELHGILDVIESMSDRAVGLQSVSERQDDTQVKEDVVVVSDAEVDSVATTEEEFQRACSSGAVDMNPTALCSSLDNPSLSQQSSVEENDFKLPINETLHVEACPRMGLDPNSRDFSLEGTARESEMCRNPVDSSGCINSVVSGECDGNGGGVIKARVAEYDVIVVQSSETDVAAISTATHATAGVIDNNLEEQTASVVDLEMEQAVVSNTPLSALQTDQLSDSHTDLSSSPLPGVSETSETLPSIEATVICNKDIQSVVVHANKTVGEFDYLGQSIDSAVHEGTKNVACEEEIDARQSNCDDLGDEICNATSQSIENVEDSICNDIKPCKEEMVEASTAVQGSSETGCDDNASSKPMPTDVKAEEYALDIVESVEPAVCATLEGFQLGRLGNVKMPNTINSTVEDPVVENCNESDALATATSEVEPTERMVQFKNRTAEAKVNTPMSGQLKDDALAAFPANQDGGVAIAQPPKKRGRPKLQASLTSSPACSEPDNTNFGDSLEAVVADSLPVGATVNAVKKQRGRGKKVLAVENVPTSSQSEESVPAQSSVPIEPLKKRGRSKNVKVVTDTEVPDVTLPSATSSSVEVNEHEKAVATKKRGRSSKNGSTGESASTGRNTIESEISDGISTGDKSLDATTRNTRVGRTEAVSGNPEGSVLSDSLSVSSSNSAGDQITAAGNNLAKPTAKRGLRSNAEIKLENDPDLSLEVPIAPAKRRGRPRRIDSESVPTVNLPAQPPPGTRGQKRKLVEEGSITSQEQEDDMNIELPRKRGKWAKKPAVSSEGEASAITEVPPLEEIMPLLNTPCPTEKAPRGKKNTIALHYEEMERIRGKVSAADRIRCAKCNEVFTRKQFAVHNKSKHSGLGWIAGEIPVDMKNLEQVRYCLWKTYVRKSKTEITCEVCKVSKRSIEGFMAHLELYCEKSTAEQEAMRVECPICARVMLPTSLKVHMGTTHKSGLPEPVAATPPQPPPQLFRKRLAATKAAELIAHLKNDEVESKEKLPEDPEHARQVLNRELMKRYKKRGGPRKVTSLVNARLKNEMNARGIMSCKNKGCDFTSPEMEEMHLHYEICAKIPPLGFSCTLCGFKCKDEDEIKKHVATAHNHSVAEEPNDPDFPGSSSASEPEPDEVDTARGHASNRRSTSLFSSARNASLVSRVKFLSREISAKVMGDSMYLPTSKWWLKYQTENFRDLLFPSLLARAEDLVHLDAAQAADYLPTERESIPLASLMINNSEPRDPNTESDLIWKRLGLFEAAVIDDVPVFFAGGPVWAMAWCPIPTPLLLESGPQVSQYLAVACHQGMDNVYTVADGRLANGAIQIWDFGPMDHSNPCRVPRMALALAHDRGAVWHMEWCPSGCYDRESVDGALRRMGLLAAACSDGRVHIFAVPFPAEVAFNGDCPRVVSLAPSLTLICGGSRPTLPAHDEWMCTRLSWHKSDGHVIVAGAFTNGMACLWDLGTTSPLLTRRCGRTQLVFARQTFQAHQGSVTALSLFPNFGGRYLMTGGVDRLTKIWDLEQTGAPIATSLKGVVTDGVWLSHWVTTVTSYDDGFSIHHGNTMLHSVRNFGFCPYPLLPQNSPVWSVSGSEWSNAIAHGTVAGELCVIFPHQLFIGADTEKGMKYKRMVIGYVDLVDSGPSQPATRTAPPAPTVSLPGPAEDTKIQDAPSMASSSKPGSEIGSKLGSESVYDESRDVSAESESDYELGNASDVGSIGSVARYEEKDFMPGNYGGVSQRFKLTLCHYPLDDFKTMPKSARHPLRVSETMRSMPREMYPISSINRVSWNPNCTSHLWLASGYQCGLVRVPCIRGMQNTAFARELFSDPAKQGL